MSVVCVFENVSFVCSVLSVMLLCVLRLLGCVFMCLRLCISLCVVCMVRLCVMGFVWMF